jgi:hypothetical protein
MTFLKHTYEELPTGGSFFWTIPLVLIALCMSISSAAPAQSPEDCHRPDILPFRKGEVLRYELNYNWGFIWAKAGWVEFSVSDTIWEGQRHLRFRGHGSSFKNWDWFYKVRSAYTSVTDYQLRPKYFSRKGTEGSQQYNEDYYRTDNTVKIETRDKDNNLKKKELNVSACAFDVISAIYHCRTIAFKSYRPETVIPLELYLDGEIHQSPLRYKGIEMWKHPETKEMHRCIVFKPTLLEGTVFKKGENMTVYVSDDFWKVPIYIETELKVGKAKIYLTEKKL